MSGSATRARVLGAVLFVVALHGCQTSGDGTLPAEDRLLEEVMEAYISARLRFYPVESTLAGLPGNDARLGDYSKSAVEGRIRWLVDFHFKLTGLRLNVLSRPGYLDALWLTSLVRAELFELEERALWRRTASFYVDGARVGLVSLLADSDLSLHADALAGRLGDIPRVLEYARENVAPAADVWRADGLASLEACRALLEDLPERLEGHLPPGRVAEIAGLSRVATRAVQDFIGRLSAENPSDTDQRELALGEPALERYFFYEHMVDWPLDEIVLKAEERLSVVTNELTELALAGFPTQSLAAVTEPESIDGSLESAVVAAESRVLEFVRQHELAGVARASLPVRVVPAYFPGSEPVHLWRPRALEPTRGSFLMVRDVYPPDASELELVTLREVGGRARLHVRQAGSASLLRRVFAARATTEAWLTRFERRALDAGYRAENLALRIEHHHRAMIELLRLLAVIEVHANGASLEEVAALFRERGLLSRPAADSEAERAAIDPGVSARALGALLMDDLASDYFRAHPLKSSADLEERLLADGPLPVRLLRFELGL